MFECGSVLFTSVVISDLQGLLPAFIAQDMLAILTADMNLGVPWSVSTFVLDM